MFATTMIELHREFARALLEALPGGVAFIDRHERVQWVNNEFAALLGTDKTKLFGRAARTLPFPLRDGAPGSEQIVSVGDLVLIERILGKEPMVGRLLQVLPRKSMQGVLASAVRNTPAEVPAPTGVLPRDVGLQRLATEISRSRRYENPLSCLVGRIDGYDNAATAVGLKALTNLLIAQLRWVDVLVQWEADRVLVLLPETGAEAAFRLQRKLASMVEANWPVDASNVRTFWGAATWRRGDDTLRLVRRAEAASLANTANWTKLPR